VTSLAGSLPKVTPRDVLTGGVGTPWRTDGMTRKFYPWMWEIFGGMMRFFLGWRWEVVIGGAYMSYRYKYKYIYI